MINLLLIYESYIRWFKRSAGFDNQIKKFILTKDINKIHNHVHIALPFYVCKVMSGIYFTGAGVTMTMAIPVHCI